MDINQIVCKRLEPAKSIIYYNYNLHQLENARRFFANHRVDLPFQITVMEKTLDETINAAYAAKELITLVGADTRSADVEEFFSVFIEKKNLCFELIGGLKKLLQDASRTESSDKRRELLARAHRLLLESGYVIPLGQLVVTQYYPKEIQGISIRDRVHGFPRIDLMVSK
ncbi:MAG: hypothetical protein HY747_00425 [Elusimicrobia bacterium]|nr:hypothetical protein [Elusimicrobiota bacterium]